MEITKRKQIPPYIRVSLMDLMHKNVTYNLWAKLWKLCVRKTPAYSVRFAVGNHILANAQQHILNYRQKHEDR